MTAGGGCPVLDIHHALFRDADEAAGSGDTGEDAVHHGAALVHHHGRLNVVVNEILHNVGRTLAADLLAPGEGEIDVVFRLEALSDEIVRSGQCAVEGDLGIQCAPTPENAVLDDAGEGGLFPVLLVDGHHIVVSHQHCRLSGLFSRPAQQQRPIREPVKGAGLKHMGIQPGKQGNELFKFGIVLQGVVVVGNGFAPNQLSQRIHGFFPVKFRNLTGSGGLGLGFEGGSPDGNDSHENRQRSKQDP